MKTIAVLLNELAERGIILREEMGNIAYRAPSGALTHEDKEDIRGKKKELLAYLRAKAMAEENPENYQVTANQPNCVKPSFYQEVWWHWFRDSPVLLPYETVSVIKRFNDANITDLKKSVSRIVDCHDSLRMHFWETEGEVFANIHDVGSFAADIHHLQNADALSAAIQAFFHEAPRIADRWLAKSRIFALPQGDAVVTLAIHHVVCDGASRKIVMAELDAEAVNPGSIKPSSSLSFREFSIAERTAFSGERFSALTSYWSQWNANIPILESPLEKKALVWRPGRRITVRATLDRKTISDLISLPKRYQTSLLTIFIAVYFIAIESWSGQKHFSIRLIADGRTHSAIKSTVGLILRHYVLEALSPASVPFASLIRAIEAEYESAIALRYPTHSGKTGADSSTLHERIAATLNFAPAPVSNDMTFPRESAHDGKADKRTIIRETEFSDWSAALPPLYIRVLDASSLNLVFEFNGSVINNNEQDAFISSYLAAIDLLRESWPH